MVRWEVTLCCQFAGCPQKASCTGNLPQRLMCGALALFSGKSSPMANSPGSSWPITRYTFTDICTKICVKIWIWVIKEVHQIGVIFTIIKIWVLKWNMGRENRKGVWKTRTRRPKWERHGGKDRACTKGVRVIGRLRGLEPGLVTAWVTHRERATQGIAGD